MNKTFIENYIIKALKDNDSFFCISYFEGDISWAEAIKKENYIVYNKSNNYLTKNINHINIENVGYNIYSYFKFIIDNYENLPNIVVFCKNNVFIKHIKKERFIKLINRKVFTSLEDNDQERRFPIYMSSSDFNYNEINNSWYKYNYPRLYFSDFNEYFNYIFEDALKPNFNNFAPGANYIVPRSHILSRSKNFYLNLMKFISHNQLSCESHFIERSLISIWNSNIQSSEIMDELLTNEEIESLKKKCIINKKAENKLIEKMGRKIKYFPLKFLEILFKFIK